MTGGNAGVGYATAEALLAAGSDVVLACRSLERARDAATRLAAAAAAQAARLNPHVGQPATSGGRAAGATGDAKSTGAPTAAEGVAAACPGRVDVELLDLASLDSVRRFAARWEASGRPLDLLILNAGIMCPPQRHETADGFELQFQVRPGAVLAGSGGDSRQNAGWWGVLAVGSPPLGAPLTVADNAPQSNFLAHFELANRLVRHTQRQRRKRQQGGKQQPGQEAGRPLRVLWLTSMTHWGGDLSPAELADVPSCRKRYVPFQVRLPSCVFWALPTAAMPAVGLRVKLAEARLLRLH